MSDDDGPPRAALIAALVLPVAGIGAVLAVAATRHASQPPTVLAAVPAPHAGDPACHALLDALPQRLGDYDRATVAQPAPEGAAAWRGDGEPVVMRCGLDRPDDFVVGSPIQVVDAVQWFQVRADDRSTWYAVDRPVYVALTLPPESGPAPIQQLSRLIEKAMTAVPINPTPVG